MAFARRRLCLRGRRESICAVESAVPVGTGWGAVWWVNTNSFFGEIRDQVGQNSDDARFPNKCDCQERNRVMFNEVRNVRKTEADVNFPNGNQYPQHLGDFEFCVNVRAQVLKITGTCTKGIWDWLVRIEGRRKSAE